VICVLIALTVLFSIGKISITKNSNGTEASVPATEEQQQQQSTSEAEVTYSVSAAESVTDGDKLRTSMYELMSEGREAAAKAKAIANIKKNEDFEIDPDKPMIALTFDDGPAIDTVRILEILKDNNCHATFCVVGNRIKNNAKTLRKAVKQGNQVVGHSWDHKQLTKLSKTKITLELTKTNNAIKKATGVTPDMYRPPYGAINDKVRKISKAQGLSMLLWSVDSLDWKYRTTRSINSRIMSAVRDGSIILCHDIHPTTAVAMEKVIPALVKEGYQLVTVKELMKAKGIKTKPGKRYAQG
jgi:peptidoglycan/xylan/chitin deacetylase (PgdA/CDA1 family)